MWDGMGHCSHVIWLRCCEALSVTGPALVVSTSAVERYHAMNGERSINGVVDEVHRLLFS